MKLKFSNKNKKKTSTFLLDQKIKSENQKKKLFLNLIIFFLFLSMIIIIYFFIDWITNSDKTAVLNYYIAPSTSKVIINQQPQKTEGRIKLKPGNYIISVSNDGFNSLTKEIELKSGEAYNFYESLDPDSTHQDFYKNHPDEQSRLQHIADFKADLESKKYSSSDPVFKVTPYSSYKDGFSISAEKQTLSSKIKLNINLFTCIDSQIEELKSAALNYLKNNQINLDHYDVNITNC